MEKEAPFTGAKKGRDGSPGKKVRVCESERERVDLFFFPFFLPNWLTNFLLHAQASLVREGA